jgi:hypothetical protein
MIRSGDSVRHSYKQCKVCPYIVRWIDPSPRAHGNSIEFQFECAGGNLLTLCGKLPISSASNNTTEDA